MVQPCDIQVAIFERYNRQAPIYKPHSRALNTYGLPALADRFPSDPAAFYGQGRVRYQRRLPIRFEEVQLAAQPQQERGEREGVAPVHQPPTPVARFAPSAASQREPHSTITARTPRLAKSKSMP